MQQTKNALNTRNVFNTIFRLFHGWGNRQTDHNKEVDIYLFENPNKYNDVDTYM